VSNPQIPQGVLNRILGSVVVPSFPALNVTASFLGAEMIRLAFDGDATTFINTGTGAVTSGEPYQMVTVTVHLLKTQQLSALYEKQRQSQSVIGDITVRPDVSTGLQPYDFTNCAIQGVRELAFDGKDAGYAVILRGYQLINSSLWG
jgi:hypothetical protein